MEKKEIRKQYKILRNKMSEMEVKEKSDRICQNIISSNLFQQAERILAYAPLGNEVDIRPVIEEGWRQEKRIAFPKVFGDTMRYFEVSSFSQLKEGYISCDGAGGNKPCGLEKRLWYWFLEWLLIVRGTGMGYGKGYYDRFFEGKSGCVKAGVAYELQVADQLPTEENDLPVEYLVTEKGVWKRQ